MSQLYSFIRRKRRPLQAATIPAPADFVCPHCGRSAADGHRAEPAVPAESAPVVPPLIPQAPPAGPVVPVTEPVKVSKLKKSRGNAPKI